MNKPTKIELTFVDRDGRKLTHTVKFWNWKNMMEDLCKMDVDVVEELSEAIKQEAKILFNKTDLCLKWGIVYEEGRAFGNEDQFEEKNEQTSK